MRSLSGFRLMLVLHVLLLCVPSTASAQQSQPTVLSTSDAASWETRHATHVDGLPDIKANKSGTLTLTPTELRFTSRAGSTQLQRDQITAVSAGNERVELWGIYGRIIRMAIPQNGGLAVAAVAHHRIDMLTVEFVDPRGGSHAAVFFVPANEATRALHSFALAPSAQRPHTDVTCTDQTVEPGSILVTVPNWEAAKVPEAYQALVYEHIVERLRKAKEIHHVYRDGETIADGTCPQYIVHMSVKGFHEGNNVKRAAFGPVGMFVSTTQMTFDASVMETNGPLKIEQQLKSTVRGEKESTSVADMVAKSLAKRYEKALKQVQTTASATTSTKQKQSMD